MPKLGDFIAVLLTEAAQARMKADVEILKIAELYSGHELLKHLPVPRFRLPEIHVDVPVVMSSLKGVTETADAKPFAPGQKELATALGRALADSGIEAQNAAAEKAASAALKEIERAADRRSKPPLPIARVAQSAAVAVAKEIGALLPDAKEKLPGFEARAAQALREVLVAGQAPSPYLEVRLASGDIKSLGSSESATRFRFTLVEDAYEVIPNGDDQPTYKLVPE